MLWEFKNYKNSTEIAKKNCSVNEQGLIPNYQVQNWFSKLHSGNMSLRVESRRGCSSDLDQDVLRELVECSPLEKDK